MVFRSKTGFPKSSGTGGRKLDGRKRPGAVPGNHRNGTVNGGILNGSQGRKAEQPGAAGCGDRERNSGDKGIPSLGPNRKPLGNGPGRGANPKVPRVEGP